MGDAAGPVRRGDGARGYPKDFSATVTLFRDTTPVARGVVRTNEPLFHEGYGIYIKNFGTTPWGAPYAVFDANRDPGAPAILAASLLFTAANLLYLFPTEERCVSRCRCEQGRDRRLRPAGSVDAGRLDRGSPACPRRGSFPRSPTVCSRRRGTLPGATRTGRARSNGP